MGKTLQSVKTSGKIPSYISHKRFDEGHVSNTKNTIELNGKYYDVQTGAVVESSTVSHQHTTVAAPNRNGSLVPPKKSKGRNLDGFFKQATPPQHTQPVAKPAHAPTKPLTPHKPQKTNTLMRHAVTKPAPQPTKSVIAAKVSAIERKDSATRRQTGTSFSSAIHQSRIARAQHTNRSTTISRFAHDTSSVHPTLRPTSNSPVVPVPAQPAPFPKPNTTLAEHIDAKKKPRRMKKKLAIAAITTGSLAVMAFAGSVIYMKLPSIKVGLADAHAGINATIPGYQPGGFSLSGPITSKAGQVAMTYVSKNHKTFTVTQKASSWDSQALFQNYIDNGSFTYQIYEDQGRTVYVYNNTNATWVSGGIWYNVHGNASLTQQQLLNIASSLQ